MGATGKVAVVSHSDQRATVLLIPVIQVNLWPALMPCHRNGYLLARGPAIQMSASFAGD